MTNDARLSILSLLVAAAAGAASVASVFFSWQANSISREAFNRASGRILPVFNVECSTRHLLVVGEKAVEPDTLLVTLRNDGKEAIEAVRYDILMNLVWSGERGENQPLRPSRASREFNNILQPGQTETIDIAPDVAAHIKTLKTPIDKPSFWTPCTVSFSAKIVGSTYFAFADNDKNKNTNSITFGLTWDAKSGVHREPLNFGVGLPKRQ